MSNMSDTTKELLEILPRYAMNSDFVKSVLHVAKSEEERKYILDVIKKHKDKITGRDIVYIMLLMTENRQNKK